MKVGDTYTTTILVTQSLLAKQVGSGDLEVFSTPSMIALMENASMLLAQKYLPNEQTTVGSYVSVKHIKPTLAATKVSAQATLKQVEGNKLTYTLKAWDEQGDIGIGEHVRYIVNIKSFIQSIK
jgi:predicted thioesterase